MDSGNKLFLLDAYALIYRAYYAFIKNPRINSKGFNTSAILGFVNTLEEVLKKENPTHIGVAFDPAGPTFRHEAFEQYKAQREETPEAIRLRLNPRYADYVVFPVIDDCTVVGYVSRHTWSKEDIDAHNRKTRHSGGYKILRYRNSTENDFSKLLYNYDAVRMDETDTVILAEGIFDVIALTRRLELYDNSHVAAVATFGKKISDVQIYKLQSKGVRTVVIGYDGDAVESVKRTAERLKPYFEVFIADIADAAKDWDELTEAEIYGIFACRLLSVLEYKLKKVQER